MNNLIQNYKIILEQLTNLCSHIPSAPQIRTPKLSDLELVALNLTAEYMSINSELQLFRCISQTELEATIERSVYNKRKRKLFAYIEKIRETLSSKFADFTDVFIVDSTPVAICKTSRANRSTICSTNEIKPAFGYCAAQKTRYFGYKLHAVCDKNGISDMLASIAGVLYAHYISYIDPTSFAIDESIFILSIVIIGGMRNLKRIFLAVAYLVLLPEALRFVGMPTSIAANMRQIIYGIALILVIYQISRKKYLKETNRKILI